MFREFRSVSAGKPMWVTECNVIVPWKDENTKEPSEADLRVQSERVTMIYSMDIYEGAQAVSYASCCRTMLNTSGSTGVLRPDLTPRPSFSGRGWRPTAWLLADARPLGRVQSTNSEMHGYLFNAKPDGRPTDVLVLHLVRIPMPRLRCPNHPPPCFDHLGRTRPVSSNVLKIGPGTAVGFSNYAGNPIIPRSLRRPSAAKLLTGRPGPVVMQALLPDKDIVLNESAYKLPEGRAVTVPIFVYNFGAKSVRGKLKVKTPPHWAAQMDNEVEIKPGERKELRLLLTRPETSGVTNAGIRITGHFRERRRRAGVGLPFDFSGPVNPAGRLILLMVTSTGVVWSAGGASPRRILRAASMPKTASWSPCWSAVAVTAPLSISG